MCTLHRAEGLYTCTAGLDTRGYERFPLQMLKRYSSTPATQAGLNTGEGRSICTYSMVQTSYQILSTKGNTDLEFDVPVKLRAFWKA